MKKCKKLVVKTLKNKLTDKYGDNIFMTMNRKKKSVVCLKIRDLNY